MIRRPPRSSLTDTPFPYLDALPILALITGGGLLENIPRLLPEGTHAVVDADGWEQPRLMAFLQAQGNIEPEEMARTFNCGVGMVLAVDADGADAVAAELEAAGETVDRKSTRLNSSH